MALRNSEYAQLMYTQLVAECERMSAEIERLRAALEHISAHFGSAEQCREIAQQALQTKDTHSSSTSTFGEPEDQQETEQWESEKATCKHHGWPPGWKCIECGEIVPELEKVSK
jgi:hypothetical protein